MDVASEQVEGTEWVISIREKLEEAQKYAEGRPWESWCIYRVPRRLRDVQEDNKAYVPQTVSIGPHHLGSEQVSDMDRHKWVALHQILEHTGQDLNLYLDTIKEVEEHARDCYQQAVHLSSTKFVEMMVLDGCFILFELFRCYSDWTGGNGNPVFSNQRIIDDILLDMVMMENQIPLFVIEKLLGLIHMGGVPGKGRTEPAMDLILSFFNPEWLTGKPLNKREFDELRSSLHQEREQEECLHVLDVLRKSLLYAGPQRVTTHKTRFRRMVCDKLVPGCLKGWLHVNTDPRRGQVVHRVTDLREGGVKFRKRNASCFWDIRFQNGVLEIPTFWIHDSTMTILLNVTAFEHCHLKIKDAVIASYVVFMECLIKSPEDVGHFRRCGIIQHLVGDDAKVVDMFNWISKEIFVDAHGGNYAELSDQVNTYYNKRRNRWRASLLRKYFNNPWAIISLVAASILLILTAVQSFYAVYAYYRPNST